MEIERQTLFPKDALAIAKRLSLITKNEILDEEKYLVENNSDLIVNQKRLRVIGHFDPTYTLFSKIHKKINDYAYPFNLLQEASRIHASEVINDKLSKVDFQIIQKMHAVDELQQSLNVIDERIESWKVFTIPSSNLDQFCALKQKMVEDIDKFQNEIRNEVERVAPNTSFLIGPLLTARLLVHAGSFGKLASLPASSVQLLGAEKALFRYKKEGGKPPKHGVLFQHESLIKAPKRLKGRIARLLSLKIILAIRADVFTKRMIGEQLKNDFDDQIKQIFKQN